ncbi:MAG TPA: hypothetical protein VGA59_06580 [Ramlibacter sp.]
MTEGNYFLTLPGRAEPLHIGKSSAGWRFKLHVEPGRGIEGLADWEALWRQRGAAISHAGGAALLAEDMRRIIAERRHGGREWTRERLAMHGGEPGPNGLARHRVGGQCVGHGDGTFDLFEGFFR